MKKEEIAILGVMNEDPFHYKTWSGLSKYFFSAIENKGNLTAALASKLSNVEEYYYKAISVQPRYDAWRFKYSINLRYYKRMTKKLRRKILAIDPDSYSVLLQVGAWYDLTGFVDKPVISYHDGNIATLLSSPYGYPKISASYINKVVEYERRLYEKIHIIFPMSKWLAGSFTRDFGIDKKKVHPVGAGVNLPYIGNSKCKDYTGQKILFVGKAFERKGGKYLIEAFRIVRKALPQAELTIVGPQIDINEKNVNVLGSIDKINTSGIDKLIKAYEDASVFVMPSLYEPFGVVFCEAMAHRLPCIGTNICAMPEIIADNETGILIPPRDAKSLAQAIIEILKTPEKARYMGEEGYNRYLQRFTWNAVVRNITDVIEEMC